MAGPVSQRPVSLRDARARRYADHGVRRLADAAADVAHARAWLEDAFPADHMVRQQVAQLEIMLKSTASYIAWQLETARREAARRPRPVTTGRVAISQERK